ncbi:unnamed protein product [Brassica rapa]|uniref:Uncharacterized protein n=2 Tax=Brassica TaxID=3705 RepID=A0A8D9HBB4_BRACM|nr:unnamed protein product [Brassica rapa]
MSSLWRLRGCPPKVVDLTSNCRRSQAAAAKLANLTSISSEGLMVDRLRLFTSSHHSFQPETSGYSVNVAMFTRSCLAEDDTLITQLFVKTEIVKLRRQSERWKQQRWKQR